MSFVDVINQIIATLQNDAALTAFCQANAGKALTVKKGFRDLTEIAPADMPLVRITRPQVQGQAQSNVSGDYGHTVRLYLAWYCDDAAASPDLLIQFEEAVETALMKNPTLNNLADFISPSQSNNDEGKAHPRYFIKKDFAVQKETVWQ